MKDLSVTSKGHQCEDNFALILISSYIEDGSGLKDKNTTAGMSGFLILSVSLCRNVKLTIVYQQRSL